MQKNYAFECNHSDFGILADLWPWLPVDQKETFRRIGAYTALHGNGLRIISINTNVYAAHNKRSDDCGQMDWLRTTLKAAKAAGEKFALIVIQSTSECTSLVTSFRRLTNMR